jgi:protein arginine kinase
LNISLDPKDLAAQVSPWLRDGHGPEEIVVSCRVRLARNLAGYPFASRLGPDRARELAEEVRPHLLEAALDGETRWVAMEETSLVLRLVLRERHLISRDLAPAEEGGAPPPGRAVAFGVSEGLSVMVNEEDHLRLQAVRAGFALHEAREAAVDLDRRLESRVAYACDERLGYLTGCPTNVGTGLRASVMLHLPALGMVRSELEKVFTAAQRTGLAVRGLYGEGSRAAGDFYQISNQVTLGRSEDDLVDDLCSLVPVIERFERRVREEMLSSRRGPLRDRVTASLAVLRTSRSLSTEEALAHLSNLRLGVATGLLEGPSPAVLGELGVLVQKGHLQALEEGSDPERLLDPSARDGLRARVLRQRLA